MIPRRQPVPTPPDTRGNRTSPGSEASHRPPFPAATTPAGTSWAARSRAGSGNPMHPARAMPAGRAPCRPGCRRDRGRARRRRDQRGQRTNRDAEDDDADDECRGGGRCGRCVRPAANRPPCGSSGTASQPHPRVRPMKSWSAKYRCDPGQADASGRAAAPATARPARQWRNSERVFALQALPRHGSPLRFSIVRKRL